jgi:hypothetical protein
VIALLVVAAAPIHVSGPSLRFQVGGQELVGYPVDSSGVRVGTGGPGILEIAIRQAVQGKRRLAQGRGNLRVVMDGGTWTAPIDLRDAGGKPGRAGSQHYSAGLVRQLRLPQGMHTLEVFVDAAGAFVLTFEAARTADEGAMLRPEHAGGELEWVALAPPEPPPPPTTSAPTTTTGELSAATTESEFLQMTITKKAQVREPAVAADASLAPEQIVLDDPTLGAALRAVVDRVASAMEGQLGTFHRIAVPPLQTLGIEAETHHLGKVVAAGLQSRCAALPVLVPVGVTRIAEVLREHRVDSLGLLSADAAAAFARAFAADSILAGTVSDAEGAFVVHVRHFFGGTVKALQVRVDRIDLAAAAAKHVQERTRSAALLRGAVFPGWGQLYNDEPQKSLLLGSIGAAALGTAAYYYVNAQDRADAYRADDQAAVPDRAEGNRYVRYANTALIGYAVVWGLGLADAYLSGRNEVILDGTLHW